TIGAFYDTISAAFATIKPPIVANANFINMLEASQIKSVDDAVAAIDRIKAEGEGTQGSPDQPQGDSTQGQLAHYDVFKEMFTGKQLQQTNGQWGFTGAPIPFPTVFNFTQSNQQPSPSLAFNQILSQLLMNLQACWATGAQPNIGTMFQLQGAGRDLIQQHGIRPEFMWVQPPPAQMQRATRLSHLAAAARAKPSGTPKP